MRSTIVFCAAAGLALTLASMPKAEASLLGVDESTGNLYSVSESNATTSFIGSTGIVGAWADIQFAPSGTLYGFTDSATVTPTLYKIDPTTAAVTAVGPLNTPNFVFEGALTFAPGGTAYAMNIGRSGDTQLFTINLATGAASTLGVVGGANDINGLAYRSDGKLIGLDDNSNSLLLIDPITLTATTLAAVPTAVGAIGGMTVDGGVGYYVTGADTSINPGSDDLYSFNLVTGASTFVGNLGFTDDGLSGLAALPTPAVPEPSSIAILGSAVIGVGFVLSRRRDRGRRKRLPISL
jgi:hypothetical protein